MMASWSVRGGRKGHIPGKPKKGPDSVRRERHIGGRWSKLSPQQEPQLRRMVSDVDNPAPDAARRFRIQPATVCRPPARTPASASKQGHHAKSC